MRTPRPFRFLLVLALGLSAAGCAATSRSQARTKLDLAGRDVFDALQFGDYQVVANYLVPELRTDFLARSYGAEKSLKVLEFTPLGLDVDDEVSRAKMVTRLSWYELPSTSVKTENVFLDWRRTDAGWRIERITGGPLEAPDPGASPPTPAPATAR